MLKCLFICLVLVKILLWLSIVVLVIFVVFFVYCKMVILLWFVWCGLSGVSFFFWWMSLGNDNWFGCSEGLFIVEVIIIFFMEVWLMIVVSLLVSVFSIMMVFMFVLLNWWSILWVV